MPTIGDDIMRFVQHLIRDWQPDPLAHVLSAGVPGLTREFLNRKDLPDFRYWSALPAETELVTAVDVIFRKDRPDLGTVADAIAEALAGTAPEHPGGGPDGTPAEARASLAALAMLAQAAWKGPVTDLPADGRNFTPFVPRTDDAGGSTQKTTPGVKLSNVYIVLNKAAREMLAVENGAGMELAFDRETHVIRVTPGGAIKLRQIRLFAKDFFDQFGIRAKGTYPAEVRGGSLYVKLG